MLPPLICWLQTQVGSLHWKWLQQSRASCLHTVLANPKENLSQPWIESSWVFYFNWATVGPMPTLPLYHWGGGKRGPLIDLTQADVTSRAETGLVPHPHPRDPAWDPGRGVDGCWGHPSTCSLRNIDCWAFYGVKPGESSMSLVPPVSAVWQTHLWLTTHKGKDQQGNGPMTTTSSHGLGEAWLLLKVVSWRQIEWPRGILWICLAFSRGRTGKSRSELAVGRARFITE